MTLKSPIKLQGLIGNNGHEWNPNESFNSYEEALVGRLVDEPISRNFNLVIDVLPKLWRNDANIDSSLHILNSIFILVTLKK